MPLKAYSQNYPISRPTSRGCSRASLERGDRHPDTSAWSTSSRTLAREELTRKEIIPLSIVIGALRFYLYRRNLKIQKLIKEERPHLL